MKKLALFVLLSCFGFCLSAQMGYLFTSVDSVLIGEPFEVKLEFSGLAPEDITSITWDTLDKLEHRSLIDSQLYKVDLEVDLGLFKGENYIFEEEELVWTKDDQVSPPTFSNNFTFTVWELCAFLIPGPTVTFKNGSTITLSPRFIYVKDPLLQQAEGVLPSESIIRQRITYFDILKEFFWWIVGVIALIVLFFYAQRWYAKRKKKDAEITIEEAKEEIPVIPAHILALEKLHLLKNSRIWDDGKDKEFVSQLTDIIREYIENRFGVRALEMTTQEISEALQAEKSVGKHLSQLQNTLNVSDLIKFAKAKADSNLYEQFVDDAIDLVDNTKKEEISE